MSDPAGPPPPYPGYSDPSNSSSYPPPSAAFPAPYDPTKGPQSGYPPAGYPGGNYPTGYSQPGYPGGGYSQPYGTQPSGFSQPYSSAPGGYSSNTTVVVAQPAVTVMQTFRESPVHTNCMHCRAEVVTGTHYETGTFTWVICCVLWLVGCGLGCCLIPFCVDGCKDVIHTCPNCHQQIARFSRM